MSLPPSLSKFSELFAGLRPLNQFHEGFVVFHQFAVDEVAAIVIIDGLLARFPVTVSA